jgi:glutamate/tyrosine decarboxylase-like PLP-dependent enzyme
MEKKTMGIGSWVNGVFNRVNPNVMQKVTRTLTSMPMVKNRIDKETDAMMVEMRKSLKPYREGFASFTSLPTVGVARAEIIAEMEKLKALEQAKWKDGFVSGGVYNGDDAHVDFLNQVYAIHSQSNPLHADVWPSTSKFEAEIVAMTAHMLCGDGGVCGTVSSGGTESILLAMKTYRDRARDQKGITAPEMIAPTTAHAAFDKAAQYFGIKMIRVPVDANCRADVAATEKAITLNTIVIIGSAPSFPQGVVDPIAELSELARTRGIGFHTDGCLGGFVLPWAEKLGYPVPPFDFRLPGVTSISADTHKYGYAAKGSSVVLYRDEELRRYQYFTVTDWPGGLYLSPTFAGSRAGALSAACWAAMVSIGEKGYMDAAKKIFETTGWIREEVVQLPDLQLLGESLLVIAFGSKTLDIYCVLDQMGKRHWSLNGLQSPAGMHLCVTQRHTEPGVAEKFVEDLKGAVEYARAHPEAKGEMGAVYGMTASVPMRGIVGDFMKKYIDMLYETGE